MDANCQSTVYIGYCRKIFHEMAVVRHQLQKAMHLTSVMWRRPIPYSRHFSRIGSYSLATDNVPQKLYLPFDQCTFFQVQM